MVKSYRQPLSLKFVGPNFGLLIFLNLNINVNHWQTKYEIKFNWLFKTESLHLETQIMKYLKKTTRIDTVASPSLVDGI